MTLPNILSVRTFLLSVLVGLATFLYCTQPTPSSLAAERLQSSGLQTVSLNSAPQTVTQPASLIGLPTRLRIPKLNLDAAIDPMGLTSAGDMEAPSGHAETGWYKFGSRPGEKGAAVIAGHYGRWASGEGSVFDQLHTLQPGDRVSTVDDAGVTTTFVVRESRRYDPDADATEVFSSSDGQAHLNLITCEGTWSAAIGTYPKRLVVFTDQE